jgi:hypothetical protein
VTVVYVDLADYLAIAVEVTGLALDTILRTTDLNLADSALHAASIARLPIATPTWRLARASHCITTMASRPAT